MHPEVRFIVNVIQVAVAVLSFSLISLQAGEQFRVGEPGILRGVVPFPVSAVLGTFGGPSECVRVVIVHDAFYFEHYECLRGHGPAISSDR